MELSWLMLYTGGKDVLSFKGDDEGFVGDVGCTFSGVPACPVEVDVELFVLNESSEHMEAFSFYVSLDKDDSVASSKGVYGRSGKSTVGEVGVIRHGVSVVVMESVVGAIVFSAEAAMLKCMNVGNVYAGSRFEVVELVCVPDVWISEELLKEEDRQCGGGHDASWSNISRAFMHSWMTG